MISPNITPDKEYGIGTWSDDDFYRALHNGIRKDGNYLYPVFPFDHFTKVTRDDVLAIKAYLFSLPPVHDKNEPNTLAFPYDVRSTLAVWRALFFKPGEFRSDPSKSAEINRGAYLVEGLAHCGACHTARNFLGASISSDELQGSEVQGWYAPNITSDTATGIGSWSGDELTSFLKTGASPKRGIVLGPMAETVHDSLAKLTNEDIHAIAAFLKATAPKPDAVQGRLGDFGVTGSAANLYVSYCASCHQLNGEGVNRKIPPLADNGSVNAAGPQNIVQVVLRGLIATGNYGPMPPYALVLSDQEIAAIANYIRTSWGKAAPANTDPLLVAQMRQQISGERDLPCQEFAQADKLPDFISEKLTALTYEQLTLQMPALAQEARAALKDASVSGLTNGLTGAFCVAVERRQGLSVLQKRNLLNQFAQLAYTQFSGSALAPPQDAQGAKMEQ